MLLDASVRTVSHKEGALVLWWRGSGVKADYIAVRNRVDPPIRHPRRVRSTCAWDVGDEIKLADAHVVIWQISPNFFSVAPLWVGASFYT